MTKQWLNGTVSCFAGEVANSQQVALGVGPWSVGRVTRHRVCSAPELPPLASHNAMRFSATVALLWCRQIRSFGVLWIKETFVTNQVLTAGR